MLSPPSHHHTVVHEPFFLFALSLHPSHPRPIAVTLLSIYESVSLLLGSSVSSLQHHSQPRCGGNTTIDQQVDKEVPPQALTVTDGHACHAPSLGVAFMGTVFGTGVHWEVGCLGVSPG